MTTPEQLANQIRAQLRDVETKVNALRSLGFEARIECGIDLKLIASKTVTTSL